MKKILPYILPLIVIIGVLVCLNFGLGKNLEIKSAADTKVSEIDMQTQTPEQTTPSNQVKPVPPADPQQNPPDAATNTKGMTNAIPILMYHEIGSGPNSLYVPTDRFRAQMKYLYQSGYHTVTMTDALGLLISGKIPAKTVVITFDDGYESFYTRAWPIMQEYNFTGTMYVISSFPGKYNYLTWDEIRTIQAAGIEIGSHSQNHLDLKIASASVQSEEILGSKKILEKELGVPVNSFCYPSGSYGEKTPQIVKDAGYTSAVTVAYGHATSKNNFFLLPRVRVPG